MDRLKVKSSQTTFDRHAKLKYKYRQRSFQRRGYFGDTAGKNTKVIKEYIANRLSEDKIAESYPSKK